MTCQGTHRPWFNRYDSWPLPADLELYVADTSKPMTCWTRCHYCKLPIGVPCVDANGRGLPDAAITPAVAIEIRAAALVDTFVGDDGSWHGFISLGMVAVDCQHLDVFDRDIANGLPRQQDRFDYLSGWLAARIAMHDKEHR